MLIILGGVGGAVVSWAGNLINNLINHKREIKRLTYLRKLEVCENAMGVIGTMRDKLVPILVLAKQDPTYQTCDEVSQWCADLHKYLNTTMTEIYKLYLYFDLEKLENKYKLNELMPKLAQANVEIIQVNIDIQNKTLTGGDVHNINSRIKACLDVYFNGLELMNQYFSAVAEMLKKEIKC